MSVLKKASVLIVLSMLSGLLFHISWLPSTGYFIVFIAFVPLLAILELSTYYNWNKFVAYLFIYLGLLIWNFDVFWIFQISKIGGLLTILINTLILSLPFVFLQFVYQKFKGFYKYLFFILAYLTMEVLHHKGPLAFPFFTLGNVFGSKPQLIQWYEYTGVLGGSAWILIINIIIFKIFDSGLKKNTKSAKLYFSILVFCLFIPIGISYYIFNNYKEQGEPVKIAAIQTNLDCYDTKYLLSNKQLVDNYLVTTSLSEKFKPDIIFWPETAIAHGINIDSLKTDLCLLKIRQQLFSNNHVALITGAVLKQNNSNEYNSLIFLQSSTDEVQIKTKSKCVPFTEYTPYPLLFDIIKKYIPSLGGYQFSIDGDYGNAVFNNSVDGYLVTPYICYESAFYNFNLYENNKKQFMCTLLNEGWYQNQKVSTQFMYFAALRSIENRKDNIRSSNIGISCFISQKGEISHKVSRYDDKIIMGNIRANNITTVFARYSAVYEILVISLFVAMLLIFIILKSFFKNNYLLKNEYYEKAILSTEC